MKTTCSLFLFVVFFLQTQAQQPTQSIRGTILDKESQRSIPGATIIINQLNKGTASDMEGAFELQAVPVGRHTLVVSFLGYEPYVLNNIILSSGKELVLTIELTEAFTELGEVVVKAKKNSAEANNEMAVVSARSFSVEETQRYAAAIFDPARMALNFAGVNTGGDDLQNEIVVRGNSPKGILWRLEGVEIPNPNHFDDIGATGGAISMLSSSTLAASDFYTGAFPAEYGNATSGVFDLQFRNGNNQKREYAFMVGIVGIEASLEGPFSQKSKASYLLNYRYSNTALLASFLEDAIGSAIPKYQDLSFKVNLPTNKWGTFSLFGLGGYNIYSEDLELDSTKWNQDDWNFEAFRSEQYKGVVGLSHRFFLNQNSYIKSVVSASANNFESRNIGIDNVHYISPTNYQEEEDLRMENEDYAYRFNSYYNGKLNKQHTLRLGGAISLLDFSFLHEEIVDGSWRTFFSGSGDSYFLQAYGQWKYRIVPELSLHTGFHYARLTLNNTQSLEPRAALSWTASRKHRFSLAAGLHSKPEHLSTYFLKQEGSDVSPNFYLEFIKAQHYVLSHDWQLNAHTSLKTELYYQHLYDVPVENDSTSGLSLLNARSVWDLLGAQAAINAGTGKNYGIDVSLERAFVDDYYFLITASLFDSKYTALNQIEYPTRYASNYNLTALGGKEFKKGSDGQNILGFNAKVKFGGGNRYTPVDLAASQIEGETVWSENYFSQQVKDYFRIDVGFSYKMNRKKATHTLLIDFQNATNRQNVFTQRYNADTQQIDYWCQTGILPVFNYRIEF